MCTTSAVSTYNTSYLVRTCRCNCASCCTCRHSTGKGRGPQGQDWLLVDDTSQRTSHFHRKVHQYTSFCKYRAANTHLGYFAPSMLPPSTGNRNLPLPSQVPQSTFASSGPYSPVLGTASIRPLVEIWAGPRCRPLSISPKPYPEITIRNPCSWFRQVLQHAFYQLLLCFILKAEKGSALTLTSQACLLKAHSAGQFLEVGHFVAGVLEVSKTHLLA